MKINRTKDAIERAFWTFCNSFLGLLTAQAFTSIDLSAVHKLEAAGCAAAFTTIKTLVAQHAGGDDSGAAIPGGITNS